VTKRAANQKSARNATTHGLFSATLVIREPDRPIYDEMAAALRADLHPEGAPQESVFANLIANSWNPRRVRGLLASLYDGTTDPLADPGLDAQFDRLSRYEQRFERACYRAIAELRRIQTDDAAIANAVNEENAIDWSPLIDVNRVLAAMRARKNADHAKQHADLTRYLSADLPPFPDGFVLPAAQEAA
jgi:hypothetical protein